MPLLTSVWTTTCNVLFTHKKVQGIPHGVTLEAHIKKHTLPMSERVTVTTLTSTHTPYVRSSILALKNRRSERAQRLMSQLLTTHLEECLSQIIHENHPHPISVALLPVPLSLSPYLKRGYNQVAEVLRASLKESASLEQHMQIAAYALTRLHTKKPQKLLKKLERFENVRGAFMADPLPHATHIIIIDDVYTTGSTLAACATAVRFSNPRTKLSCITLARASK